MKSRALALLVVVAGCSQPLDRAADPTTSTAPVRATATTIASTTTTAPPARTVSVAAVGDWLSERAVYKAAEALAEPGVRYDHVPLLEPVIPLIQSADLAICHMETPIGVPGARVGEVSRQNGFLQFVAPYELAADLAEVGFDRCSTASNHSMDLGLAGIDNTLNALDAAGISHSGTARTAAEAVPTPMEVNGVKVAHIASTLGTDTRWPVSWRLNQTLTSNVINDVATARAAGAEIVILSIHIYASGNSAPRDADRARIEEITSQADVDLIVFHGPHTIQPVEVVNGTVVYWSLGNLISGMGEGEGVASDPRRRDGLMAMVEFEEQLDGSWEPDVTTVLLCNVVGSRLVYPGVSTLADESIDPALRLQLQECVDRATQVVPGLA